MDSIFIGAILMTATFIARAIGVIIILGAFSVLAVGVHQTLTTDQQHH